MRIKIVSGFVTLLFILLSVSMGLGATRVYLPQANQIQSKLNQIQALSETSLKAQLGLTQQEALQMLRQHIDKNNYTHRRYQQLFNGIPVWGHHIIAAEDPQGNVISLHGTKVTGIAADMSGTAPSALSLSAQQVLAQMKARHIENSQQPDETWEFKNEVSHQVIYIDGNDLARLCYLVSFFADIIQGGLPARPTIIVDAASGEILREFDSLAHADGTGPGGNLKIEQYHYGTEFPPFEVSQSGNTCSMSNPDVKTVNLNHGTTGSTAYSYTCFENTFKEINGAYSPLNDAHFFGGVVYDMYQSWFNTPPLTFQLMMRVHYSTNYENAFWNGSSMTFGDGFSAFYPLVGLDVVSHEVSHGFTEQNSNLIYSNQSGGINEAFSDMAGEAAEYFSRGSNDFRVGYDIRKGSGALRYMDDPPKDGQSIGSANDYTSGMDVHHSSGVFNKAFYILAGKPGWDTQKAFEVFVKANQENWEPSTNFIQGAEGARDAAISLGYSAIDVKDAFAAVDIFIAIPQALNAGFTYAADLLTVNFTDTSTCSECTITAREWDFGDGSTSSEQNPAHTYAEDGSYTVSLTVFGDNNESDTLSQVVKAGEVLEYCDSGGQSNNYEWVQSISVGEFSNSSGASGYSDFTSQIIEVDKEMPYDLSLTPGFAGGAYAEYWRLWADLNRDGDFDDSGEKIFEGSGNAAVNGTITIPDSATAGKTRLRVVMSYGGFVLACANYNYGETEDYTLNIAGEQTPPTAAFGYAAVGLTVDFTDQSTAPAGSIAAWDWDFGDGNHSSAQNPSHTYAAPGTYTATLQVTDNLGQHADTNQQVTVSNPLQYCDTAGQNQNYEFIQQVLVGEFTNSSGPGGYSDFTSQLIDGQKETPITVTLTPGFANTAYNEFWRVWADLNQDGDFDDAGEKLFEGSHSTEVSGSITIPGTAAAGSTRLRVAMRYGGLPESCGAFTYGEVEDYTLVISGAQPTPMADFDFTVDGLTVTFADQSTTPAGPITAWDWDFGDGNKSTEQNPSHTYSTVDTYPVSLTVTDSDNQTAQLSQDVTVSTPLAYCDSAGSNQSYEYIQQVTGGAFSNPSGASGYSDFTSQVIEVQRGSAMAVTLTPGYPGSSYTEYWRVWADVNSDGVFDDPGDLLFEGSGNGPVSGSITVSVSAAAGSTRLRVTMRYGGYADSCGSNSYGETEDYTLNILP